MNENIIYGIHSILGNTMSAKHSYSDNVMFGMHVQEWFGDRFIAGIQDEDLNFILDKTGSILLEE